MRKPRNLAHDNISLRNVDKLWVTISFKPIIMVLEENLHADQISDRRKDRQKKKNMVLI